MNKNKNGCTYYIKIVCAAVLFRSISQHDCADVGGIMDKMIGKRSVQFVVPPCFIGAASVAGD